jgi:hypothetical protein
MTITANGNISVRNGRVLVDGKDVTPDAKDIRIEVHGDVGQITADSCVTITVTGAVRGDVSTQAGDVQCGDVGGSVATMAGDVKCGRVAGNVKTMSGDIHRQ